MRATRHVLLVLFALAPALAFAQIPDSVHVAVDGVEYPAYGAAFGERFPSDTNIMDTLAVTEPSTACRELPGDGVEGFISNPEEIKGKIALIERGGGYFNNCPFVTKVQAAQEAGAVAVVVYNNDEENPDAIFAMSGDCPPSECAIPAAMISFNSALAILTELDYPKIVTIIPVRIYQPPTAGTHDTGVVQFDVYDQGFLGTDVRYEGTGFVFAGDRGLLVSSVLVGIDGDVVSNPYDGLSEWTAVSEVEPVTPPTPFDQAFQTSFENMELGVRVTERSYSRANDPFVIVELEVENVSGSGLNDVYIGLFADFNVGTTSIDDVAAVNEDLNLVYVYDPVEAAPYFGVVAITPGASLSGYSADATTADDAQLFEALTRGVEIAPEPAERAVVIGVGPFDLAAGVSSRAMFAFVGGSDELDMIATANELQFPGGFPAVEGTTPEGTYVLTSAYPNPFGDRATIAFTLPTAQEVRLAVYDVLGREVAVLADGVRPAGEQAVDFDASALPSGVYHVRLEAGVVRLVERVTVLR